MEGLAAFEKLVPVALAFGCGVLLARRGVISLANSKAFSDFAFLVAVPCYLFGNIYQSDLGQLFEWRAILGYALTAVGCLAVVGVVAALRMSREPRRIALRMMASVQVNTAYFAVPVFIMLFGNAAPIFPVLLFQVCVLTPVIISTMELGTPRIGTSPVSRVSTAGVPASARGRTAAMALPTRAEDAGGAGGKLARAVWASLNTPVVMACNAGVLFNLLAVDLPPTVTEAFSFVGNAASPVALFALGLHVGGTGLQLRGTSREEIWIIAAKGLVFPLVMWLTCAYVFGLRGEWLTYLVLIAAMPAPQNLFIFAQRYGVDVELSASLVIKSSLAALLLLPLWIHWAHAVTG